MYGKTAARDDHRQHFPRPIRALAVCRNPLQPINFTGTRDSFPNRAFPSGDIDMKQALHHLSVPTRTRGLHEITRDIHRWIDLQDVRTGLLTVFLRHTSASLLIQENADPDVRTDLEQFFETIAPEAPGRYVHDAEGPDDMPAHLRTALTQVQLSIPIDAGRMVLGTWQGIYVFEHRRAPSRRDVVLHLFGE